MPVFSIPLSGLTANSTALSAIANNLANLNTVGYKQTRAVFRDLFYQTLGTSGSGSPIQLGTGSAVGELTTIFSGGSIEPSGLPTDVAIKGNGFFVVQNAEDYQFTRAGNFHVGDDDYLVSEEGQRVMGYPAVNGTIPTGQSLGPLCLGKGQISPASATTSLQFSANLNADQNVGTSFSTPVTVYDSLGGNHVVTFKFTKTDANEWSYEASMPGSELDITPGKDAMGNDLAVPESVTLSSGTLQFGGNGKLIAVDPPGASRSVSISTSKPADASGMVINGLGNGAENLSMTWALFSGTGEGLLTQAVAPSNASTSRQDGMGAGSLLDFAISEDGLIQGLFSNGKTMVLGQLALANFANPEGLSRAGSNNFSSTLSSGVPVFGVPGSGGRGTLAGGALELSNVDIAREFAQMIMAQRGFQANARAITTFDEIAQETINLKR
ncbi:MAG TPA: flagellar hook protein FlgE [Terriglobales bacterium]|nr:flagellar hook protein FlgE [Terriglobales bacterium]